MSRICEICDKGTMFGHNRKHRRGSSGGGGKWRFKAQTTNKQWLPNLRSIRVETLDGGAESLKVCMKCYKRLRNLSE